MTLIFIPLDISGSNQRYAVVNTASISLASKAWWRRLRDAKQQNGRRKETNSDLWGACQTTN